MAGIERREEGRGERERKGERERRGQSEGEGRYIYRERSTTHTPAFISYEVYRIL
jgi:hypothetical protein